MALQQQFPLTFSRCALHNKKNKKLPPALVTQNSITYDTSVIPMLTQTEIDNFIHLQITYPDIINKCFDNLIEILQQQEQQMITRSKKK